MTITTIKQISLLICVSIISFSTIAKPEQNVFDSNGIQLVIFDWAGTTVDYGSLAPVAAFKKVFEEKNVPISDEEAKRPMGVHKRTHIQKITELDAIPPQTVSVKERWKQKYGQYPTTQDIDKMFQRFVPLQKDVLQDHSTLIPGTLETVSYIKNKGWKVGSSTGFTKEMLDIVQKFANEQGYQPDFAVASDMVPHGRPYPDMIWLNCAKFNATPSRVVKVDDTLPGIEAGNNAGVWTVMVLKTGNALGLNKSEAKKLSYQEFNKRTANIQDTAKSKAHFVIMGIDELPPVLEKINSLINQGYYPFTYPFVKDQK